MKKNIFIMVLLMQSHFIFAQTVANFTFDTVCLGGITQFQSSSTTTLGSITQWKWDLTGNGVFNNALGQQISFQFGQADTFNIGLEVTTDSGQTDQVYYPVIVLESPNASFTVAPVCVGSNSVFLNKSQSSDSVNVYTWSFGDASSATDSLPMHTYASAGTYNVALYITNSLDCQDSAFAVAIVHDVPEVNIVLSSDTTYCQGDSAVLVATSNTNNHFWTNGHLNDTLVVKNTGWFYLTAYNDFICSNRDSVYISELGLPLISASGDTIAVKNQALGLWASGGDTYQWTPSEFFSDNESSSPFITVQEDQMVRVTAFLDNGCSAWKEIMVSVQEDIWIEYNETFSPNGDGFNDYFIIENIAYFNGCNFMVINKYGDKIFEELNYDNDWDGTYKGKEIPEGTYYFLMDCVEEEKSINGPITIIR